MTKSTDKKERQSTPPPSYDPSRNYQEHPIFYTKDVFFQLDNTLYKFPEHYFRNSVFRSQQIFPEDTGISGNGSSESPFTCTKIDRMALQSFLSLKMTAVYDESLAISGKEAWLNILKVSYFWKMKKLGEFAVDQLSKMQLKGIDKLKLAKTYDIQDKKWQYSAIRELINSTNLAIKEADVEEIGVDVALKLYKLHGMGRQRWFLQVSDENIKNEFPELF